MATARQRYRASMLYASDHDDHLPPANRWQEVLAPFLSDRSLENRSCLETSRFDRKGQGFAMDSRLSCASVNELSTRILFFETTTLEQNAHDPGITFAARHQDMVTKQPDHGYLITLNGNVRALNQDDGNAATQRGTL